MMLILTSERVQIGDLEHVIPIGIAIVIAWLFITFSKLKLQKQQQGIAIHIFAISVSLFVLAFHLYKISLGNYNIATDLPLYLCSLLAIIIPIFTYYKKYWMYEILLFWIIAGTSQGVITPDIAEGYPSLDYFRYWIVHLGLLIVIFYATIVFNMKPKLRSVFKSYFALQLYVIAIMGINYVLEANYFYLNRKPKSASLLDHLGEWPYYLIVAQLILMPLFLLIYFPFYLQKRTKESHLANS